MIPRSDFDPDPTLPIDHTGWTPARDDLAGDDGFGGFRDTWVIRGVTLKEARDICDAEAELVSVANLISRSPADFEAVCQALENWDLRSLPAELATPTNVELLQPHMAYDPWPLGGLDLGVAGIVNALCAVRCYTAASCRGHPEEGAWSHRPVVYMAADRDRARALQTLVAATGCGFAGGAGRLVALEARSIEDFAALARAILGAADSFRHQRR